MKTNDAQTAQKLLESFNKFKRLHLRSSRIDGVRPSEIHVLFCIKKGIEDESNGIKISYISQHLNVASPTITQHINNLEANGLIERTTDKEDRRAVRVNLTDKGENTIKEASGYFNDILKGLVEYLGEEKSNQLSELLSEVYFYFKKVNKSKS